ncbi:2-dehydropantoate 2-reductase [Parashewanella spongiae]|uniref:2-dehydropantoate 2-reductase n=1 Tax=Parashewanella spongiae TaxID=342950 RepID=A0A3A6TRU6_9GAMM|nr:2-dehydropantoate 2-reductase [Parashewanella spongiae]MCL1078344.1 2-dehydropantoate 2-reductase [Parashewanella spongiae]RJY16897.1 2-dehydropantoate 2-reductase [Parashewanella spongiae]
MSVLSTSNYPTSQIGILGAGAIGQLIGFQINSQLQNQQKMSYITQATGLISDPSPHLTSLVSQTHHYNAHVLSLHSPEISEIKLLIVAVKAYQVFNAISHLITKLPADCHILLLHNGLGPHLEILPLLQPHQGLSLGTTSQGAQRIDKWHVKHTGKGLTQIGHYTGIAMADEYRQLLSHSIPDCDFVDEIIPALWQKLAVNCVINPLTAIHQCKNGILQQSEFSEKIQQILFELNLVAQKEAITLDMQQLTQRVLKVIQLTSNNYSSMFQDIQHKKLTEIDYINGYLLKVAQKHGIQLDVNQQLVESVQLLAQ